MLNKIVITCIILLAYVACDLQNPRSQGELLYNGYCGNCHMEDGKGLKGLYPPLAQSDYLANHQAQLTCIIAYGMEGPIEVNGKTYDHQMPGYKSLNAVEIHNIINYINNSWGNKLGESTIKEVESQLKDCPKQ